MIVRPQIHLISNSHLDPVWLWDWREGMVEVLATVRSIISLMEEYPEVTYIRGESFIYEQILREDPQAFEKIKQFAREGRWDVVGGSFLQADLNLPATETLLRQYQVGQRFFKKHFGQTVEVAWQTDSFGHSAGLPEIYSQAGIRSVAFFRPAAQECPLPMPAFWWQGPGGHRVLAYRPPVGWYGCERDEMPRRLDHCLEELKTSELPLLGCFYGLGNHGGGPSRRHIEDIRAWSQAHPEVEVVHSGLHPFFRTLQASIRKQGISLPIHHGELNFCLRGIYSATARIKFPYRKAEAELHRLERSSSAWSAARKQPAAPLEDLWRDVLFNTFHDILPGTSHERATDEQIDWLGGTRHRIRQEEYRFLKSLGLATDTTVPAAPKRDMPQATPILLFNPQPIPYRGLVELEAGLDYRPLEGYQEAPDSVPVVVRNPHGKVVPHQKVRLNYRFLPELPWRQRVTIDASIPAMGWAVYTLGLSNKQAGKVEKNPFTTGRHRISNGAFTVQARPGDSHIRITYQGKAFPAAPGLSLCTMEDPWGAWGGVFEEPESFKLTTVRERWKITSVEVLEKGPLRAALCVRLAGGHSHAELTVRLARGDEQVTVEARILWNEHAARLKLRVPGATKGLFDVPGGALERGPLGEVPGGRWVWCSEGERGFGFASDALYNFNLDDGALYATIVRAHQYSSSESLIKPKPEQLHLPVSDKGEYRFHFLLTPRRADLERLATELEEPPYVQNVAASPGEQARSGSLLSLKPAKGLKLLALTSGQRSGEWIVRLQSRSSCPLRPTLTWRGQKIPLPPLPPFSIHSIRLHCTSRTWEADVLPTSLT